MYEAYEAEDLVEMLLDLIDRQSAARPDYEPVMPRATAERAMHALLRLYATRNGSAASIYAAEALTEALEGYLLRAK
jgi:hypothetical protein